MIDVPGFGMEERLFLLMLGGYVALVLGGPRWLHTLLLYEMPARGWRAILQGLEARLNRSQRPVAVRRSRGRLLVGVLAVLALAFGAGLSMLTTSTGWGWYAEVAVIAYLIPLRAAVLPVLEVHKAVRRKQVAQLPALLQPCTDTDLEVADGHGMLRAAVEHLARSFPRLVVAPACWYVLLGMPGLMLCRILSCLSDAFPMTHPHYRPFGAAAATLDRLMQAAPVRIAVPFQWLALAFVPRASLATAAQALSRSEGEEPPTTRTLPLRMAAYGLKLSLGGARRTGGQARPDAWIGSGRARLENADLSRALLWYAFACTLWLLALTGLTLV